MRDLMSDEGGLVEGGLPAQLSTIDPDDPAFVKCVRVAFLSSVCAFSTWLCCRRAGVCSCSNSQDLPRYSTPAALNIALLPHQQEVSYIMPPIFAALPNDSPPPELSRVWAG